MQAHPMILPHEPKDSKRIDGLSPLTRKVYSLLYDMVDGYASAKPVWSVTRYVVRINGTLYGTESITLSNAGWRAIPSLSNIPLEHPPISPNLFSLIDGEARIVSLKRQPKERSSKTVAQLILHMDKTGLGRPATYAKHAQSLLDNGLITSLNQATLTNKGHEMLSAIRASTARRFTADFTRSMLKDLDAIESGLLSTEEGFANWLKPEVATMAEQWLLTQSIEGDLATISYEARDQSNRESIYWPAGIVPKVLDPELTLPVECEERAYRRSLNREAAHSAPDWLSLSAQERVERRISVESHKNGMTIDQWKVTFNYDILRRWTVGWLP